MAQGTKTGGRQSGTPNKPKRRLLARLEEDFPEYHPVAALAEMAHERNDDGSWAHPPELRAKLHADIAKYVEPTLKAIEHSGKDGRPIVIQSVSQADDDL